MQFSGISLQSTLASMVASVAAYVPQVLMLMQPASPFLKFTHCDSLVQSNEV